MGPGGDDSTVTGFRRDDPTHRGCPDEWGWGLLRLVGVVRDILAPRESGAGGGVAGGRSPGVAGLGEVVAGSSADDSAAVLVETAVDSLVAWSEVGSAATALLDGAGRVSIDVDGLGVGGVGEEEGAG